MFCARFGRLLKNVCRNAIFNPQFSGDLQRKIFCTGRGDPTRSPHLIPCLWHLRALLRKIRACQRSGETRNPSVHNWLSSLGKREPQKRPLTVYIWIDLLVRNGILLSTQMQNMMQIFFVCEPSYNGKLIFIVRRLTIWGKVQQFKNYIIYNDLINTLHYITFFLSFQSIDGLQRRDHEITRASKNETPHDIFAPLFKSIFFWDLRASHARTMCYKTCQCRKIFWPFHFSVCPQPLFPFTPC